MKKSLLFLSLISMILVALPQVSFAKKKYRYIKREHGLKVDWRFPGQFHSTREFMKNLKFEFNYTYNWKGFLEMGPYFTIGTDDREQWMADGGLLVEWNIVKNRGKRAFIPAIGLKLGADDFTGAMNGHYGLPLSLKHFVAKRTPFIFTFEPYMSVPGFTNFNNLNIKYNFSGGFAYYFDFY